MSTPASLLEGLLLPLQFLTSLAIGLLLGLERERHTTAKAGLRTCALVSLFGSVCALLAQTTAIALIVAVGLLLTGAMIIAAYAFGRQTEDDAGTTTVIAVLLCYVFGVMVWYGHTQHAVGLAIATTALLHFKTELHGFSDRLAPGDITSMLQFAVLTFIVLPVLPNRAFGPFEAFNPYHLWLMVVLVSGVGLVGYLVLRLAGAKRGLLLIGALGGLVSSTATTLVYARQSATQPQMNALSAGVITIATLTVLPRLAVIGGIAAPESLPRLVTVLAAGFVCGLLPVRRLAHAAADAGMQLPEIKNPTQLRVALGFGLGYSGILFGAAWLSHEWGSSGLYAMAAVSGVADVDAISLSSLQLFNTGNIDERTAIIAIVVAYISNIVFKLGIALVAGGADLVRRCLPAFLTTAAGLIAGAVWL